MSHLKERQFIDKAIGLVKMRDLLTTCPKWWQSSELARELGVSQRTVQRWLYDMEQIGCPVEETQAKGAGQRYRYRGMTL